MLADVFGCVYTSGAWGRAQEFFSGPGSHDSQLVTPYVTSLISWLADHGDRVVVDLGCGDFNVGRQLLNHCTYIGCDCVPPLIQYNQRRFPNIDFRVCDITTQDIPLGDIALIRQVFQHLSNSDIQLVLPKLNAYKYLVVTDHMPYDHRRRKANMDIVSGKSTRVSIGSYVDLAAQPFGMLFKAATELCSVEDNYGVIRTVVYEL